MRILLLQSSAYIPSLGGANKANRLLLEQLAARGHECHVVGTSSGGGVTELRHAGVQVEAVLDGAHLRARAAARLRELAPDRVLVSSEDPGQILLAEAVQASPHAVYLAHTTLHLPFGPDGFLQSPARTALLARAAGIVAVSGYIQGYIRRWAGLDSILLRFPVYGAGPFPVLGDFGRGFVTLINPCAVKGISIFLALARRLPEVEFAAVPTWGTTAEDREALAALPNVRILPPAADVDEIFAKTRVLLAPSLWGEAFGQVAVEAMLRGIPVLASDAGGLPEAKLGVDYVLPVRPIQRYEERFDERKIPVAVVPEQDPGPWEETLRRLLGDPDLYARLSRESRRAAHEFVAGLGTDPFEEYLESLPARNDAGRRRMKILLVQPLAYLFTPGGAHKANRLLLQGLAARGHACRAVAPRSGEETVFQDEGVEVHTVAGGLDLRSEAVRQIRAFDPDWTIVSEDLSGEILQAALEASPFRVVYLAHSPATLPFGPSAFVADEAKTALLRRTAGILTVSRAMQDYLRRWAGLESTAVYSPAYGSGPFPALAAFDRGYVAMINPSGIKGLSIFAGLAERMPGLAFAAVPTWSTTAADRDRLAALPNVTLLPAADDVDEIFAQIRILVVPSLWGEAFGQVVIEALLRGIPVLTSDQGGLPEAGLGVTRIVPVRPIERYEEQLDDRRMPVPVVPEQDLDPWEAELCALLSDRAGYERISEASRHAAARFVAGLGIEPYERFLEDLAPAPAAAPPPAAAEIQRKLAGLSPEKLELLARRLKKKEGGASQASGIPRLPRRGTAEGDRFPLSFAQQRLWFLDRLDPGSLAYNEHFAIHLNGPLEARLLAAALDRIVERHEILRTAYAEEAEAPVQIVRPGSLEGLPRVDLGGLPEAARRSEAALLATAESRRPFDLERGPVMRALLLRTGAGEHRLIITAHHIAVDNWSATVFFAELSALCGALAAGTEPALPELPVQYADFAVWQHGWLRGATLDGQIDFWRGQLAGAPALLDLPTDRPRPARQSFRGTRATARFSPRLAERLRGVARQRDATSYMLLLAVFQTLLHRLTGQDDLVVGTPVAGRHRQEIEPLIGCFLNTLPMRARVIPGQRFPELLDQARRTALEAFAHQDLPFERLVEALAPERNLSHPPVFQVLFNFLNVPPRTERLPGGVRLSAGTVQTGTTRFDLELYMEEQEPGLIVALVYNTDLFDAATLARLLGHLEALLHGVAARPEEALSALPLLTLAESHQLLHEWNDTASGAQEGSGVHQLFAAQARRTPEAPAAVFDGTSITYAELAARARQLARHLRSLGCGPETRVGVALERCLDLPAVLLGVLEAGAAYVPLDPGYPRERLALVLADAAPRVLITEERLRSALPPAPGVVLCLGRELAPGGPETPAPFHDLQLAYTLYTSGSTGRPKGVEVSHRALVNFLGSMRRAPGFAPEERLLAVTSLAFDIAALEIFLPLTTGGCVLLASREEATDGALLAARLRASGAGVMQATPATWRMLLESGWAGDPGLKALCGGEALPRDLAAALAGRTRGLWNLYGPTETTVWSAAARVLPGETGPVSIGSPIAETRIHLLGRGSETVPLGVPGELYIGGAGLARGYLGRPDLTAERFVPDPLAAEMGTPGARLYRTGDLARHLPGGRMEVLGRIDHQVKLRGFRIELGEIEAALSRHPGIREAVVALRDGALVAYLVPAGETAPDAAGLREFLRASLPEPMIPAAFVELATLPLTPNRKVDRRALPAPGPAETATARFVAPRTPAEEVLAGLWSEVLGRERVGVHDSFFDLGGHSLLATRIVSRLQSVFGVELPLRALFERPTVAEMAPLVEEVRRGVRSPAAPPLVPVPREGDLPLSFAQERLWFLDQLEPGGTAYNLPVAVRLSGPLDPRGLAAAWGEILRRHEALRTTFAEVDGRPVQRISPPAVASVPLVDLSGLAGGPRQAIAGQLAAEEARRPFDLARGPLARLTVLRLGPAEHLAVLGLHHIVADGWSLGVLTRELTALYAAAVQGAPSPLPELPVQYADYAVWQRERLRGEALAAELSWWRGQLAGAPPLLELSFDRLGPELDRRAGQVEIALSEERTAALEALARRQGATLFMTLLAGWSALLSRYTAQEDVSAGSPIANRTRLETEELIGFFANTLVLRADLSGGPGFGELVARVRRTTLDAYGHQELPFERLVQELQPERHLASSPLFQVFFVLQNAPRAALELPDLRLELLPLPLEGAKLDLSLALERRETEISGTLEYRSSLCDAATAARLLEHWRNLLDGALAAPEARIAELPLLSTAQRRQLVIDGNETRTDYPREATIQELFEAWAEAEPEAPAVVAEGVTWSYRELNARANRLAHHLRGLGVVLETRVGVCLERSAELIATLLGILKAGGTYVPLDPSYPAERLRFLLDDSGVRLVVSREPLMAELSLGDIPRVCLDRDAGALARQSGENPASSARAGHLAYVMYTSGSTGQPKGVAVPHRGVVRLVRDTGYARLGPREVFLQLAPASFDASTFEIWGALLHGARLALFPGRVPSLDKLGEALARHGVTILWLTAGLFHQMVDERLPSLQGVRQLLAGGDVLSPAHVRRALTELPDCTLINGYGPTENTTFTCCRPLTEQGEVGAKVPIGRPIANTRVYLLDRALQPVPSGIPGELFAGGDGLARGYLGRPELTAERFVPDPFAAEVGEPGGRLYRTGDLARLRADGEIEFLGRIDQQVKIRGFRVEPGEVEAALVRHPHVLAAVVLAREAAGAKALVAYVLCAEVRPSAAELREHLRGLLPEPMIPAFFVPLTELPLSPNGKVDRRALPDPERGPSPSGPAGPRTPVEEMMAGLWAEVLGLEQVGVHESFFDLGGHSLLATRIASRLRGVFGVELPLRALFERPTVAELAADVEAARQGGVEAAPPLVPVPRGRDLPLSFAQERLWFLDRLEPGAPAYNMPVQAGMSGALDAAALAAALSEVVRRHEVLRTTFPALHPYPRIAPPDPLSLPLVDLAHLPEPAREAEACRLGREEAAAPFDLDRGPLLRARLVRLEPEQHRFLLTVHHIVADGWSLQLLVGELSALYAAFTARRPSPLPELPLQYADFAAWQRRWLEGPARTEQLAYWRERLSGPPAPLELPTDRPRPVPQSFRGGSAALPLPAALSAALRALARREGATLFMVLLAAAKILLQRWGNQDDVVVGSPIAGRLRRETEGLIGCFLNTLALRTDLAGEPRFCDLLARVRETCLGAYAHQDLPFEAVLEEIRPARDLSRTPLFQVLFNLLNLPAAPARLPDLSLEVLGPAEIPSKFDMTFYVSETGEQVRFHLVYNADLFDAARMEELLAQLEGLLEQAAVRPEARLGELSLLTGRARQILPDPAAPIEIRWEGSVSERFAAHARSAPERTALIDPAGAWSYGQLDAASDRIASELLAAGLGSGQAVAVWAHRSAPLAAALLGVWKAGAAFFLLDPAYPPALLAARLHAVPPRGWIALGAAGPLPAEVEQALAGLDPACRLLLPATPLPRLAPPPPAPRPQPDGLAYVAFTSGTTGAPKGIAGTHRPLSHFLCWHCERFSLGEDDRFSLLSGLSHDPLLRDVFAPLWAGATLCIPDPRERIGLALVSWMRASRIRVAHLTPALGEVLAADGGAGELPELRWAFFGGDVLRLSLIERLRRLAPGCAFVNYYGTTETPQGMAFHLVDAEGPRSVLPVGRGISGVDLLVLCGPGMRRAGISELGEICIRTPYLSLGYLGDEALTRERFVSNPFSDDPADRLYRTGDLGRFLPDGEVELHGRADQQVKVRGFRVELGAIEAALAAHPGVRRAAVVARPDRGGALELAAFFVPGASGAPGAAELREHLRRSLPEALVPPEIAALDELPLTPNRKLDRAALMRREAGPAASDQGAFLAPRGRLEEELATIWTEVLGVERVGVHDNFFDVGGHSLRLVEVQAGIRRALGREVPIVDLFRHPTIASLAARLEGGDAVKAALPVERPAPEGRTDVALIAMDGRFPGASSLEDFWSNLRDGVESIARLSDEQLRAAGIDPDGPDLVRAEPLLDGIEQFDAAFFGFSPREAQALDPQQRVFLECAWSCLERAGYDPARYAGRIGVFAGAGLGTYAIHLFLNPSVRETLDDLSLQNSIDKDHLATRVSYKLGLRGPGVTVQTACSTSLVAVHLARQSLLAGECDMALAGGVAVKIPQGTGYLYREGAVVSPDGHCRAFDARAQGTVFGSGAGVVLLKRLADAVRDGDTIHAVLKGSAINNDGSQKVGYTAPSVDGQAEVIAAAQEAAGASPESITCVEAHGTATPLGDPIEVAGLTQAFRRGTGRTGFCAIGSVKTNVGHLGVAAGIAGLIKTALALENRQIPPSLHFETPNPEINFAASPFYVNTRLADWPAGEGPRRAGLSSFGIGGTNAHAVLEEAPPAEPSGPSRRLELLLLSARTPAALDAATRNLADFLAAHPDVALPDVAWTLQVGRQEMPHRRMLVCRGVEDAVAALRDPAGAGRVFTRRQEPGRRGVAFLFPGQGSQFPNMGRELYEEEPVFRAGIDSSAERLLPLLGRDLRELLYPPAERSAGVANELRQTRFAQPALFAVELALAHLWVSWGIRPEAMIGHSLGEYVAACLAGVFSREDALELVAFRGALMQGLPPGAMLSIDLPEGELLAELQAVPGMFLAAVNAPSLCVASGPEDAAALLEDRLAGRGVSVRRLHTSHAFHSEMMEPVLGAFAERVARIGPRPPALPFVSNLTGTWITAAQAADPDYWARHLRETVRFGDGIATLLAGSRAVLLEVGPGRALSDLARRQGGLADRPAPILSLRRARDPEPDSAALLGSLGRLWLAGVEIDWPAFHAGERRRRIPLPTYPFERRRFWVDPPRGLRPGRTGRRRFVVAGGDGPEEALTRTLESDGHEVRRMQSGTEIAGLLTDPRNAEVLERLLALEPGLRVVLSLAPAETAADPEPEVSSGMEPAGTPRPDLSTPWQAPRNGLERQIAAVWEELLGIHGLGVHDDLFELGGHSLLATRLASRLRRDLGREVPLEHLFAAPTIARLAARLESEAAALPELPPIERAPREAPLPLSFAQQRLLFLHVLAPGDISYNMLLGLRLRGPLGPPRLAAALRRLVDRHEVLRTTFSLAGEQPVQHVAPAVAIELPLLDLSGLPDVRAEREAFRLAEDEARRPFDLFRSPVLRAALLRFRPGEHVLLVDVHHIAVDGWSWGIFCREVIELYARGEEADLPALPLQYADFAVWQRSWLQGEELARQLEYWRERLAGLPPVELPADHPRPPVRTGRGSALPVAFPRELADALRSLGREEDATLFMTLLAAFFVLLRSATRRDILIVGTDIANRTRAELEGVIGLFVNQLVLRSDLSGNPTFREVLRGVRQETLEAYAHQDAPFDKLVEILNPVRDMSRTPLFQVKLVLQNAPFDARPLSELSIAPLEVPRRIVKFDLLLNLTEGAQGITGNAEYSTDLFDASTILRLLDGFAAVLKTVSERPEARLDEIEAVLAGLAAQEEEERYREKRSTSLARARRQLVVSQPAS